MAEAFVQKGAKAFISWDERVALTHTDDACMLLLKGLIEEELTVEDAVEKVILEAGPDPVYQSELQHYPTEAGG